MRSFFRLSILQLCILALSAPAAFAGWSESKEIIIGTWGTGTGQFGLRTEGGFSVSPQIEAITTDQRVIIADPVNKKHMIFNSKGECVAEAAWGEAKGPSVSAIDPLYQRDRDVITIHRQKIGPSAYRITFIFPEGNLEVESDRDFSAATRDAVGFVYGISDNSVVRLDQNGKRTGVLVLPRSHEEYAPARGKNPPRAVYIEYGEPIVAPNGDVYLWQRSEANFTVLKWTWQ